MNDSQAQIKVERRLIESPNFPINMVNEASIAEKKGGGRPPYWEMVFWWTRKPLAGARAVVAASVLAESYGMRAFLNLGFNKGKVVHMLRPTLPIDMKEKIRQVKLLDPFAGFGSIPLEAIRLGVGDVVAVELLPTAYIFLKAVLEYPTKFSGLKVRARADELKDLGLTNVIRGSSADARAFGDKTYEVPALIYDVARWGRWMIERLREDQDIRELYDNDVAVYIGTWEVRCPFCGRYTPLVGNWWLARVKGKRYAYMKPRVKDNRVAIEIVEGETSGATQPNIRGGREYADCLLCGAKIGYADPETGKVYRSKNDAKDEKVKSRLEFYPKYAMKEWNEKLEAYLEGRISWEELLDARARPRLLAKVKVVGRDLRFEPATEQDDEKLRKALKKLKQMWGDPDIPTESIAIYESRRIIVTYGFTRWFKLFNPRQLLTLVKLVKLIREAGKRVEEEKLREGWSREDAYKYAEAVTTYLAIALCKHADWNSVVSGWQLSYLIAAHTLAMRGIAMVWNWGEYNPLSEYRGTIKAMLENVLDGLAYLFNAVSGSPSRVRVLLDDATTLSKLNGEKFDVIVTDPPYRDDVPYAELSDFYYVWLKRALSDDNLALRFHKDALIYNTQWEQFAQYEVSYNASRLNYFHINEAGDYYEKLLGMAFNRMSELLKDDGLLVTYFAHSSPEAWTELIDVGWRRAGLRVTKAWPLATESAERVTARGKTALGSSIVVVWRKRAKGGERRGAYVDVYGEAIEGAKTAKEDALRSGLAGSDVFLATMIGALSTFTSYDRISRYGKELAPADVVRESYAIAARVVANASESIRSPEGLFYLLAKAVFRLLSMGKQTRQVAPPGQRIILSSQDVIVLSYGLLSGTEGAKEGYRRLGSAGIIKAAEKTQGASVAEQKAFVLLEPLPNNDLKSLLGERGIDIVRKEARQRNFNSIDALHLLEYYARQGRSEFKIAYQELYNKYASQTREAVELARVIRNYPGDPERDLAELIITYIEGR